MYIRLASLFCASVLSVLVAFLKIPLFSFTLVKLSTYPVFSVTPLASAKETLELHNRLSPAALSGDTFGVRYYSRGIEFQAFKDTFHWRSLLRYTSEMLLGRSSI